MSLLGWISQWIPRFCKTADGVCIVKTVRDFEGEPVRVMQTGGVYQSATYVGERRFEPVFTYYRSFDVAFEYCPQDARVLMIGGGGYAWPKHVLSSGRILASLDVVEIDPAITTIAHKYFYLDEALDLNPGFVRLITDDGRMYIERYDGQPYGCVVLDAFSGSEPVRSLATVEFALLVKKCLATDGAILANVVSAEAGEDISFLRDAAASFATVFDYVYAVPCEEDSFAIEDNYLLVATDSQVVPEGAMAFDRETLGTPMFDADL